jgi:hypothetical protein
MIVAATHYGRKQQESHDELDLGKVAVVAKEVPALVLSTERYRRVEDVEEV